MTQTSIPILHLSFHSSEMWFGKPLKSLIPTIPFPSDHS